MESSEIFLFI